MLKSSVILESEQHRYVTDDFGNLIRVKWWVTSMCINGNIFHDRFSYEAGRRPHWVK